VTDSPLLEIRGLEVSFPMKKGAAARAVDGVDLTVREGEVLALVGESGCGKTTLARAVIGLQRPTEGEVSFRGEPLRYDASSLKAYRRGVQMVFQDPSGALNPRQTIYEAVAEGLRIHGLSKGEEATVAEALSISGLRPPESFFGLYPYEVSGGQRQRVVIAGAMALDPWLLVADEPVSALDASVRGEILALMLRLVREKGVTILVVTHDLGLAWNIADRIAVMYLGRIVELADAEEIFESPKHPYTAVLMSAVPRMSSSGAAQRERIIVGGDVPSPTEPPAACVFHPRCPRFHAGRCDAEEPQLGPVTGTTGHAVRCYYPLERWPMTREELAGEPGSPP
jgi:oligopeptide/dipeptide ABC transporter ATP-binding protein